MKKLFLGLAAFIAGAVLLVLPHAAEAKSYIKSYNRSSGVRVESHIRYKADGYKFNNYSYRPDRGYRK